MKSRSVLMQLVSVMAAACIGCQDIVEPNLAKSSISVLAPGNGIVSPSNSITFWWDELKGATKYRLQVVKPNFSAIQALLLDTSITTTKFSFSFAPGVYQWRVRADNGSSSTDYATRSFSVDTTSNLANAKVVLLVPVNNSVSKVLKHLFTWASLANATEYRFEVYDSTNTNIYTKALITTDTTSYTFPSEGKYHWEVKALNSFSVTSSSNIYYITISQTAPPAPTLTFPAYGDTASSPVTLKWTRNSASIIGDSVYIASDSLISSGVFQVSSTTSSYSYTFSAVSGTKFFWKAKSFDAAGNISGWSALGKFKAK